MEGHKTIVEILLAKGADVNAGDVGCGTPLDGSESLQRRDDSAQNTKKSPTYSANTEPMMGEESKAEGKCVMY